MFPIADAERSGPQPILRALGDPVRLRIDPRARGRGGRLCGVMELGVSKSTRSHHFKTLREAGLTSTRVEENRRHVSLRRDDLDAQFPGLIEAVLQSQAAPVQGVLVASFCSTWRTMRQLVLIGSRKLGGSRIFRRSS